MSRHGTLLPIPEGSELGQGIAWMIEAWPDSQRWPYRSRWLSELETRLSFAFPQSSSADRKLTARHYAPFPLALGPDVP